MKRLALVVVSLGLVTEAAADMRRPYRPPPPPPAVDMGAELGAAIRSKNTTRVVRLLGETVHNYGIWFADAACAKQFGQPGVVTGAELQAFARCLMQLRLQATTRQVPAKDAAILTYDPGIELELAHTGGRLRWIGYLSQTEADHGRPTLTAQAFEALRKAGKTNLDDAVSLKLEPVLERAKLGSVSAWAKLCLDEQGALDEVDLRQVDAPADQVQKVSTAFEVALRGWRFRPFQARGQAMAVCTMTLLTYPASRAPLVETLPPSSEPISLLGGEGEGESEDDARPTRELAEDVEIEDEDADDAGDAGGPTPQTVPPTLLEAHRTGGNKNIVPDAITQTEIARSGKDRLVTSYKLCLDARGAITTVRALKSSGFAAYDAKIKREMRQWTYKPYVVNGAAVPVCTAVTFLYSLPSAPQRP